MRPIFTAVVAVSLCSGCTSTGLKYYTLNQAMSVSELRYRQAMHALALVANDAGNLPSFALTAGGTANLTNTVSIDTSTLWDASVFGFSKETLTAFGQHNPDLQWTLDPVVTEPQLEALADACLWVLKGPPTVGSRPMELLRSTTLADVNACASDVDYVPLSNINDPPLVNRIRVAVGGNILYIRVWDANGSLLVNTDDTRFTPQARQLLRAQLNGLVPGTALTPDQMNKIHDVVTMIVGPALTLHFGVADQLFNLTRCYPDWLHVGPKHGVPKNACYKAACGDTAVWVDYDGMAGLSEFVLVLLDIGTTDPTSLSLSRPAASVVISDPSPPDPNLNDAKDKVTEKWSLCQDMSPHAGAGPIQLVPPAKFGWLPAMMPPLVPVTTKTFTVTQSTTAARIRRSPPVVPRSPKMSY
jgi:hypothetical protein